MNLPSSPKSLLAGYHVLLIEANSQETEIYSDLIREVSSCQIDVISQVEGSFDWLAGANYHLIVIDTGALTGPSQSDAGKKVALDTLERIKRVSAVTSVIVLAENGTVEEAVNAVRMGAEDYLQKPFNPDRFKLAVKRSLDRKTIFSENVNAAQFLNLINSCQMISSSLEEEKIFGIIQSYFVKELKAAYSMIYRVNSDGSAVPVSYAATGDKRDRTFEEIIDISFKGLKPVERMEFEKKYEMFFDRGQLTPGVFAFMFPCSGNSEYICVCLSPEKPSDVDSFESRIKILRSQIELAGKNIDQYMGVQHLVYVDDATGLYNTRYLDFILDREIKLSEANESSFAVLFVDADHFKSVNDRYGHLVGTKLLNELGRQLKKYVRDSDTVFRYGGDEFIAVLSGADLATAEVVAERIRKSVEKRAFLMREGLDVHFTVSIGIAIFPIHAKTKKTVIEMADHAMYAAKRKTRNCVFVADAAEMKKAKKKESEPKRVTGKKKSKSDTPKSKLH